MLYLMKKAWGLSPKDVLNTTHICSNEESRPYGNTRLVLTDMTRKLVNTISQGYNAIN